MAGRVEGDVEILVHAAAPSRGKDDAHYRALASAYLRFEPVSHQRLSSDLETELAVALDEEVAIHVQAELQHPCLEVAQSNTIEQNDGYKSRRLQCPLSLQSTNVTRSMHATFTIESPRLSFSSVLDNLDSPTLGRQQHPETPLSRPLHTREPDVPGSHASWHTPPSMIADSQSPYNYAVPEFSSPTRVLELYLQHFDAFGSTSSSARQDVARSRLTEYPQPILVSSAPSETGAPSARTASSSSVEEVTEIVLATPPFRIGKNRAIVEVANKRHLSSSKRAPLLKTWSSIHTTSPKNSQHPPEGLATSLPKSSNRPASQVSALRKRQYVEQCILGTQLRPAKLSKIARKQIPYQPVTANEIHPPPPATSSNGILPSNITPDLQLLATQLSLTTRFRPRVETRLLHPLERGYWSVSMAAWDSLLRERVWNALQIYIAKRAKAGWGVWCARSKPKINQNKEEVDWVDGGNANDALTELRVYCWGEVVGHVYLLLHLVSERKIKGRGAKWIDGGGEAVIIMP
jgi:hypothetical protein